MNLDASYNKYGIHSGWNGFFLMFDRNHIMVDIIAVYFTSFILCNVGGYIPQKCSYLLHAFVHPKQQTKKQRLTYTHTHIHQIYVNKSGS